MVPSSMLYGALAMGCATAALFFARFWKATRDRFFLWFALAFALMGVQWLLTGLGVGFGGSDGEYAPLAYLFRLAGYLLVAVAVLRRYRPAACAGGGATPAP
jgi:hypothetical protein